MILKYKNFHICMDRLILIEPGTPKILSLTDQHWVILKSVFHIIFDLHVVVFPGLGGPWMAVLLPGGFLVSYLWSNSSPGWLGTPLQGVFWVRIFLAGWVHCMLPKKQRICPWCKGWLEFVPFQLLVGFHMHVFSCLRGERTIITSPDTSKHVCWEQGYYSITTTCLLHQTHFKYR